jgi:MFS family permease
MLLAFTLAALTFAGVVQVWHIIALAAGLGVVNAFDAPARQAFVVEMVSREDLTNAIALNSMVFNSGRVVGPAVAGLVLAAVGSAWCFFINGVSFIAVIIGLLAMRIPPETAPRRAASPLSQLASGLRYTLAHRDILSLILLALVFSLFGISYSAVLPAFVEEILHAGAGGFGAVNAATGLGAVTGAFIMASYPVRRRSVWLRLSNLLFSAALLIFAANGRFLLSLPLAYCLGVGFMLEFTLINTLLQTRVSDDMRGRVLSLYTLTFFGISPFGNLAIGALAERWGLSLTIGISAVLTGALSLLIFLAIPHIRKVD